MASRELIVDIAEIPSRQVMVERRPSTAGLVSQLVRNRRENISVSQSGLARLLGLSQAEISQIETGNSSHIPDDLLMRIVRATSPDARAAHPRPARKSRRRVPKAEAGNSQQDDRMTVKSTVPAEQRVFIVHGHDEAAREAAARVVERAGFKAVILREQPNRGRTIIEKFEKHGETADFAVVLLTPDDVGGPRGSPPNELKNRARQNVVAELFFFIGKLGRDRVCILVKGSLEFPSDFSGIVYEPMDEAGRWQLNLATEMKAAGLPVDLNKLFDR